MFRKTVDEVRSRRTAPKVARLNDQFCRLRSNFQESYYDPAKIRIVEGRISIPAPITLQVLRESDRPTLKEMFRKLRPPQTNVLIGEYDAELLDQGGRLSNLLTGYVFGLHGSWIGKAFAPLSKTVGIGYNCFESDGTVVRKLCMDTSIEASKLDNGLSLVIRYQAKNGGLISRLFGEIRQITPNLMLGIGVYPTFSHRRKIPFVLSGPCRPYQYPYGHDGQAGQKPLSIVREIAV